MNNLYEIVKCHSAEYACIVIPTVITNPLEKINELAEKLKNEHISGRILIDFIISSGNSKERYGSIIYDNGFINDSFKYVNIEDNNPIKKASANFFKMKIEMNELPMLNNSQISLLKRGFLI